MRAPRWAAALLRTVAPKDQVDDVLGDLEEMHRLRMQRHAPAAARLRTAVEAIDMASAIVRARITRVRANKGNSLVQDYKLGVRMLLKYPGLTVAGGLALAIAIGIGAGWYDYSRDFWRPTLPIPGGDRIVEAEMRNAAGGGDERRLLHDFLTWGQTARTIEHLSAYRTVERNLIVADASPESVVVAEVTASTFQAVPVAPILGRPLFESDERPGAPPVVLLGYQVWQRRFGGRLDVVGETLQLGRTSSTIVGVMPEGFTFPRNHRLWVPLHLQPSGYAPLEGDPIRVFGRLASNATQADANTELAGIVDRTRAASPKTHEHLSPRVLAYGGESPGDRPLLEVVITHLPILLVMLVACVNVGTLIYARTATREAEIATRYALGASRGRIVSQLFVESLVLASLAAVVGLMVAHIGLKWGVSTYYSGQPGGMPFWMNPGLKPTTVLYAAVLTVAGAGMLSVLPALKITGPHVQGYLRNLGAGGATLRFGRVWTTAMIAQVALTVVLLPPAMGISQEAWRDRVIRSRFPAEQYLAVRVSLDPVAAPAARGEESAAAYASRFSRIFAEFERRIAQEPGVQSTTFADRLPGMGPAVRSAEVEATPGAELVLVPNLWMTTVGPKFFDVFDTRIIAGRDFHDGDREAGARTVLVNEAFARRYMDGASPVGRRVRYATPNAESPEPWLEIVGVVRDIGMTPTDLGEAPYVFRAASLANVQPLVMGVRTAADPGQLAPRLRDIAFALDPGLRLDEMQPLDDLTWRVDLPAVVSAGAIAFVVALGLFLSALGIFSLMAVSIARRTREIGLRAALGATQTRLLAGIFSRALVLIGSGVAAGNGVLLLFVWLEEEITLLDVGDVLAVTSAVMLSVGLLACIEPARRALRIAPTDALKQA